MYNNDVNLVGNNILNQAKKKLEEFKLKGSKEQFEEERLKELEEAINELERTILE